MAGVDTAVVGAGLIGLATAHALCRDGQGRVALFDRRLPGSGDSGRSFSMVRRHYSNAVTARLAMAGTRTIVDWANEVGLGDGVRPLRESATVPERLVEACRGNVEMLRGLGLDTRFVGCDEIAEAEPLLELDGIAGAAYEPAGGFADAQKMCTGWFAVATSRGLESHLGNDGPWHPGRERTGHRPRQRRRVRPRRTGCAGDRRLGQRSAGAAGCAPAARAPAPAGGDRQPPAGRTAALGGVLGFAEQRGRPARPGARVLRGRLHRRGSRGSRRRLRLRAVRGLRAGASARVGRALPGSRRLPPRAGLGRPQRRDARLEPHHRPLPGDRGAASGVRHQRPRLQAGAGDRRGDRPPKSPAARRRSTWTSCGRSASTRGGCSTWPTAPAPAPDAEQRGQAPLFHGARSLLFRDSGAGVCDLGRSRPRRWGVLRGGCWGCQVSQGGLAPTAGGLLMALAYSRRCAACDTPQRARVVR